MASPQIYTGAWINHSQGSVLGSTITLPSRPAGYLIAVLAIFVAYTGSRFWPILCFLIHQIRAGEHEQPAFRHQQQILLRNSSSALGTAYDFAEIGFAWRKVRRLSLLEITPIALLATVVFFGFQAAGVFVSEVTKASSSEFLINSPNCALWQYTEPNNITVQRSLSGKTKADTLTADTYSRACYGEESQACLQYAVQQIPMTVNLNATCPFDDGLCLWNNNSAFQLDTGFTDSNLQLGFNSRLSERIFYRKITTCAPIHTSGYSLLVNKTENDTIPGYPGDPIDLFFYGPYEGNNYTYYYDGHAAILSFNYNLQ
jgi:hypothetical protein